MKSLFALLALSFVVFASDVEDAKRLLAGGSLKKANAHAEAIDKVDPLRGGDG